MTEADSKIAEYCSFDVRPQYELYCSAVGTPRTRHDSKDSISMGISDMWGILFWCISLRPFVWNDCVLVMHNIDDIRKEYNNDLLYLCCCKYDILYWLSCN